MRLLPFFLALILCAAGTMPSAHAATVTFDATEEGGADSAVTIETGGPDGGFFSRTSTLDVAVRVGTETYTLAETFTESLFFGLSLSPYDVLFDADAGTVRFAAQPNADLPQGALDGLTLRYAAPFTGAATVAAVLDYVVTGNLVSASAQADGASFELAVGANVPLPGAALLFATGAGALAMRRR